MSEKSRWNHKLVRFSLSKATLSNRCVLDFERSEMDLFGDVKKKHGTT